ncbi:MAG: rod shape-determining protein MreD [Clostridiaceae bacterium]|jgi:rod shape-determining protein MreD|nr:rod shape-determining protein MreD [Clostridiaceae bacterium]
MKKRIAVLASLVYLTCLVQSTISGAIEIMQISPNFLIVTAVSVALCRSDMESAFMGLFFGLGMDILVGRTLGWYAMCLFLVCLCIGLVNDKLYKDNPLIPMFFAFFSSMTVELMYYFINSFLKGYRDILFVMTNLILPESIYNAVLSLLVYPLVVKIYKRLDKHDYIHARL